jgi:SAM-dependent methyltransferase
LLDDPTAPNFRATHAVCMEVLEHLDEPVRFLKNAKRYLNPNCKFVVTVPGGQPNKFDLLIGHRRHFTGDDLKAVMTEAGFEVELASGIGFPFFNFYRMLTTARGEKLQNDVAGDPSLLVRAGTVIFDLLFRFNLMSSGWQTIGVCRPRQ